MKIINATLSSLDEIVSESVEALSNGEILVFPTDTVYGLICDASNKKSVEKIFAIKKRDKDKALPVFVKDLDSARDLAILGEDQEKFLKENWPGAITAILPAKKNKLSKLVCQNGTIGIRVPNFNLLSLVLRQFKKPVAQTSANISGKSPTTEISEILNRFKDAENKPDVIIDEGDLEENNPSKVIDLTNNKINILRQ